MASSTSAPKGGEWLTSDCTPDAALAPEDLGEEHRAMRDSVAEFMRQEVAPQSEAIERHDYVLLRRLLRRAGEVGFLGVEIPEAYGGLGLDLVCSALAFEAVGGGGNGSFATTIGAHSGIGTWPILFFGNEEQKAKYLPGIASGEKVAAYCLTESGSGSDAMAAKCRASLSPDGTHWVLNGEKVFITNAGIADVFTVFVKIDGDDAKKACLIVERGTPGFTVGKEEHKLGIRGSSTCRLIFEDALVPRENLLGEIGKGHKIVLNTLNLGRFKLGAAAAGSLKAMLRLSVEYASTRKQFGKAIIEFDAIRAKLADMAIAAWVGESMVYRTAGLLSNSLHDADTGGAAKAIEEYTIECSLVKVALSELLDASIDEALQIFGGYGYIEEYPVARAYRDSRINRIFEGTNEINRMLAVGDLIKRGMKGSIDLMGAAASAADAQPDDGSLESQLRSAKALTLGALSGAIQTHMLGLEKEQQVLIELADMLIAVYAMESALLRCRKVSGRGADASVEESLTAAYFRKALPALAESSRVILNPDLINGRRRIADVVAAKGGYPF